MSATRVSRTLGNFRILECLGTGGAGMIWKAEDLSLGRIVALKALRPELATDGDMAVRFRAEARTLARLSHPGIASLYSLIEDEEGLFLVLEYVEGNTLAALLATSGPLPFDSAFALFHQVLDGVGHAHEAGVVHRDLKPANLMVDARGRVKVMDFGIARMAGATRTTHHGKLVGTPEYMSPEQVRGEDATIRSDLYSLGIVLFEMLTGQPPFRAAGSFELMRAQLEDAPPDPRSLRPDLEPRVAGALLRALAKLPAERFTSTREMQDELQHAGASPRGGAIVPIWRDVAPATLASEAPTLLTSEAGTGFGAALQASAATLPPTASFTAQLDRPKLEDVDAEIDAVLVGGHETVRSTQRSAAAATRGIDAAAETATVDAGPTRMLDGGPFAAHAQALAREKRATGTRRAGGLLWLIATAALFALAFGAVRLTSGDSAALSPQTAAEAAGAEAAGAEAAGAGAVGAELPRAAQPASPDSSEPLTGASAPGSKPARLKPLSSAGPFKPKPATPKKKPSATSGTSDTAQEESGWVIRR